jgi:hypothetical protein
MTLPVSGLTRVPFNKGDRVRAQWFAAQTVGLAGVQMKFGASAMVLVGTIKHIRANHPTMPTEIRVYVDPDPNEPYEGEKVVLEGCTCGHPHVELRPQWIQEVL